MNNNSALLNVSSTYLSMNIISVNKLQFYAYIHDAYIGKFIHVALIIVHGKQGVPSVGGSGAANWCEMIMCGINVWIWILIRCMGRSLASWRPRWS